MFVTQRIFRGLRFGALMLALSLSAAACDDGPTEADDEPEVESIRLTVGGTQTVTLTDNSQSGPVRIPANTAVPVTAEFLRANGTPDPLVNTQDFRLDVTPLGGGVSFQRTAPFGGTIIATETGSRNVRVELFHIGEGHEELTTNLTLTVE